MQYVKNLALISDDSHMEKEFASFIELENRVETIVDLVNKLKEDNQKLIEENEQLQNKYQTLAGNLSSGNKITKEAAGSQEIFKGLSEGKVETISKHVKNALIQLDQLRQIVMNGEH